MVGVTSMRRLCRPRATQDIVANCPDTEKRIVRFVGDGSGSPGLPRCSSPAQVSNQRLSTLGRLARVKGEMAPPTGAAHRARQSLGPLCHFVAWLALVGEGPRVGHGSRTKGSSIDELRPSTLWGSLKIALEFRVRHGFVNRLKRNGAAERSWCALAADWPLKQAVVAKPVDGAELMCGAGCVRRWLCAAMASVRNLNDEVVDGWR